jgi:copper(I)-binding protein/putative intracellular protease/amidase
MNRKKVFVLILVAFVSLGSFVSAATIIMQEAAGKVYVCPPCGCGSDDHTYDKPGYCTTCGMELVEKGSEAARPPSQNPSQSGPPPNRKRAAILIFNGVQIIDYSGPYEVFGQAGLEVFTVASGPAMITTAMGMKVTPHYTLDDSPAANVLIIPGGGVSATQRDPRVIKWIQERSQQAEYVLSVCNGAYILAKTGLLDGLAATTFYDLIDGLSAVAPKTKLVRDQRYVDNGKIITTAGISSGIDGSLYVVSKMFGKARAQMAALNMEYNWMPDSSYARASFADRNIRKVFGRNLRLNVPEGAQFKVLSTEGHSRSWEVQWQVQGVNSSAELLDLLSTRLVDGQWTRQGSAGKDSAKSAWKFTDENKVAWSGLAKVLPASDKSFIVSLRVERIGPDSLKPAGITSATGLDQIIIRDAWIQEMPPARKLTAAYLVIENNSTKETSLVAAKTDIAGAVELHRAEVENGMMRMRKLDRIRLPAGKTELTGDLHIMLIDLKSPVQDGDQVSLTLEFENAPSKTLMVPVRKRQEW